MGKYITGNISQFGTQWAGYSLRLICHGTCNNAGKAAYQYLVEQIRILCHNKQGFDIPNLTVDICFLEHGSPLYTEVCQQEKTIFVPVFLSDGYHVQTDIYAQHIHPSSRFTAPLGPDIDFFSKFFRECFTEEIYFTEETYKDNPVSANNNASPIILAVAGSAMEHVKQEYMQLAFEIEKLSGNQVHIWCANTQQYLFSTISEQKHSTQDISAQFIAESTARQVGVETTVPQLVYAYLLIPGYFCEQVELAFPQHRINPALVYCQEIQQLIITRFMQALRDLEDFSREGQCGNY